MMRSINPSCLIILNLDSKRHVKYRYFFLKHVIGYKTSAVKSDVSTFFLSDKLNNACEFCYFNEIYPDTKTTFASMFYVSRWKLEKIMSAVEKKSMWNLSKLSELILFYCHKFLCFLLFHNGKSNQPHLEIPRMI